MDLSNTGQITFGDDVVTSSANGIYWHDGSDYGIYRTPGPWTGNAYQQLRIQFDTGIQLGASPSPTNPGYDKSYVEIISGKGLMVSSGRVGIGTTTPDELLSVKGTIHSKEVKVDMNFLPDYVFKPGYHLPTLAEVKSYIDKNSHLPEIPSAQEVEKNGLNLGEMNKLLLKKVEELTLYLIEKDQKDEALQKQIIELKNDQQKELTELKQQLETLERSIHKN